MKLRRTLMTFGDYFASVFPSHIELWPTILAFR